jgi:hypothetical protein
LGSSGTGISGVDDNSFDKAALISEVDASLLMDVPEASVPDMVVYKIFFDIKLSGIIETPSDHVMVHGPDSLEFDGCY